MQIVNYDTLLFKNIFPSYDEFKSWYLTTPFSDNENDVPSEKTFSLIAYEYNDSHSAYSVESFKQKFAVDIYTFYKEFEATTKSITDLMQLTDEEISVEDSIITNTANVPELESSTNVEEINFITAQQKSINKKGVLKIKKEQLSNKKVFTVRTFVKRFKHLFIKIISPAYTFVVMEPDDCEE